MTDIWLPEDLAREAQKHERIKRQEDGMVEISQDSVARIGQMVEYTQSLLNLIDTGTFGEVKMLAKVGRGIIAGPEEEG